MTKKNGNTSAEGESASVKVYTAIGLYEAARWSPEGHLVQQHRDKLHELDARRQEVVALLKANFEEEVRASSEDERAMLRQEYNDLRQQQRDIDEEERREAARLERAEELDVREAEIALARAEKTLIDIAPSFLDDYEPAIEDILAGLQQFSRGVTCIRARVSAAENLGITVSRVLGRNHGERLRFSQELQTLFLLNRGKIQDALRNALALAGFPVEDFQGFHFGVFRPRPALVNDVSFDDAMRALRDEFAWHVACARRWREPKAELPQAAVIAAEDVEADELGDLT